MTADQILQKHEDANEMHFHQVDREFIIQAMEEYAISSQTEISDEEIEKFTNEFAEKYSKVGITEDEVSAFFTGMKWYREQLKQRQ